MKKCLFFLAILCFAAFAGGALGENAQISVTQAVTDGNAMFVSFELAPLNTEETLYYSLEKIYVNGFEAALVRSAGRTAGWLSEPVSFTITLDTANIGRTESYTVAASVSVLRPEHPITLVESQITDGYDSYYENITNYNNAGYIVATKEGDILLAAGTYDEEWLLTDKLTLTGKMSLLEVLPAVFSLPLGDMPLKQGAGTRDIGDWTLRVRKAEATEMSIAVIAEEIFPETATLDEVTAAMRSLTVTDEAGGKDFYTGSKRDISEPERLMDGTWIVTFAWSTQSVNRIPIQLRLTPYSFDAMMNSVEEVDHSLFVPLV